MSTKLYACITCDELVTAWGDPHNNTYCAHHMTTNDAAERLLTMIAYDVDPEGYAPGDWMKRHRDTLDAALAAERRATVERIRAALREEYGAMPEWPYLDRILDAEAERYDANDPDEVERAHLYGLPDAEAER